jgi:hypothetical protein
MSLSAMIVCAHVCGACVFVGACEHVPPFQSVTDPPPPRRDHHRVRARVDAFLFSFSLLWSYVCVCI